MSYVVLTLLLALAASTDSSADDGKQAFLDNNCNRCHAVSTHGIEATAKSESMRGPDLSTTGESRDAAWFESYLEKEVDVDGKKHRATYRGSDEERKVIAEWLAARKPEP